MSTLSEFARKDDEDYLRAIIKNLQSNLKFLQTMRGYNAEGKARGNTHREFILALGETCNIQAGSRKGLTFKRAFVEAMVRGEEIPATLREGMQEAISRCSK